MRTLSLTSLLISSALLMSPLAQADDIAAIDQAMNTMDNKTLTQLAADTQGYDQAYANYRLAILSNLQQNKAMAEQALDQSQQLLEQLTATDSNSENTALLAAVYGMQINFKPLKTISLSTKADELLTEAKMLNPDNPRVSLISAINRFYTPAIFGGGNDKVLQLTEQAIAQYQIPCDSICWGEAETYTWQGLAYQQLEQMNKAQQSWQQALTVNPNYGWASYLLSQQ